MKGSLTGEGEAKTFHLMIHSLDGLKGPGLTRRKPGVRSFFWVRHVGTGDQGTQISNGTTETQTDAQMECQDCRQSLYLLPHKGGP